MKVTRVSLNYPKREDTNIIAYASVVLNNEIAIHSIKLFEKNGRRFITFPEKFLDDRNTDTNRVQTYQKDGVTPIRRKLAYVHPTNNDLRNHITEAIINAYDATNPNPDYYEDDDYEEE